MILFNSLIMSGYICGIEVWACAYGSKYLSNMDQFCKQAWKYGFTNKTIFISDLIQTGNKQLW